MPPLHLLDKDFVPLLSAEAIQEHIAALAQQMNSELEGSNPLFLVVLTGAFMFAGDLLKRITIPCTVQFVKYESYEGTASTGQVQAVLGVGETVRDRTVVVVEDIIDSGLTLQTLLADLRVQHPKKVLVCSLFIKKASLTVPVPIAFPAIELENKFVVGYGLDYNQQGRHLPALYVLAE